jgi:DNA polymerase III subunit epsilon
VKLVAFDLETTGRDGERDRVIEFTFVELDDQLQEKGRWTRLVDPTVQIPKEVQELTGITQAMVTGQPAFAAHAPRIQALVADAVLVAHNHQFDTQFLNRELRLAGQAGIPPDHPCIDTLFIERQVNSHRLGETYKRYTGKDMDGAHRSEADTVATIEVLRAQRRLHPALLPERLEDLVVARLDARFSGERSRSWLDHGHRFYRDGTGTVRFGFGKYRDCPAIGPHECAVDKVPKQHEDYLLWMRGRDFPEETKATVEMILKAKPTVPPPLPAPAGPA